MPAQGSMLIGHSALRGSGGSLNAFDRSLGEPIAPASGRATIADVDPASRLADNTYDSNSWSDCELRTVSRGYCRQSPATRGELVKRTMSESGFQRPASKASRRAPRRSFSTSRFPRKSGSDYANA